MSHWSGHLIRVPDKDKDKDKDKDVDYKPVAVDYSRIVDLCQWNVGTGCAFVVDPVKVPILLTSLRNKRTDAERTRTTTATQGTHGIIAKDQQHIGTIAPAFAANIPL